MNNKLFKILMLLFLISFVSCEQINPPSSGTQDPLVNTVDGQNGEEDDDDDDDDDGDDDDGN